MLYLAMTAAEIAENSALPTPIAWMACHFSPYSTGLSNLPKALPPNSMLMLNDRTPIMGHDPDLIAEQLAASAREHLCSRILLDFERPGEPVQAVIEAILQAAPCPVGVSEIYAGDYSCPVFLPPVPMTKTVEEYLSIWQGREIWLEAALDTQAVTVTAQGSRISPTPAPQAPLPFADEALHCHYGLTLSGDKAVFTLHRTQEDLLQLIDGSPCCVGLYQELKSNCKGRATARPLVGY